jgi:outer membrane protein assembly factor BamB
MHRFRSLALLVVCASPVAAADWPQWLGPRRDGSSAEKVAPWKAPPKVLWHRPIGEGHSSPVVAAGKVFLLTKAAAKDAEQIAAYDVNTGEPLWHTEYSRAAFQSPFGLGPRATPSVVDGRVYTFGVTGILGCFAAADGKEIWKIDTLTEFKASNLFFGASCSPLVTDGKVVVNIGGPGASVVAFKIADGSVVWKSLDDRASYSSPVLACLGKECQLLQLTQAGLVSLNPADGSLLWKFPLVDKLNESSTTPVQIGSTILASSVTYGSVGLKLAMNDGKPNVEQIWKNPELTCYFSTPVAVGKEHVYLVTGRLLPPPESTLHCVEIKTGKSLWKRPKTGRYHAALLRTGDDRLLLLDDNGELALFDPEPKEYKELARSKVCGQTWAHPALSNGRLYLRDDKELICLELAQKSN